MANRGQVGAVHVRSLHCCQQTRLEMRVNSLRAWAFGEGESMLRVDINGGKEHQKKYPSPTPSPNFYFSLKCKK